MHTRAHTQVPGTGPRPNLWPSTGSKAGNGDCGSKGGGGDVSRILRSDGGAGAGAGGDDGDGGRGGDGCGDSNGGSTGGSGGDSERDCDQGDGRGACWGDSGQSRVSEVIFSLGASQLWLGLLNVTARLTTATANTTITSTGTTANATAAVAAIATTTVLIHQEQDTLPLAGGGRIDVGGREYDDIVLVTAADELYADRLRNLVGSLHFWEPRLRLRVYNLGLSNTTLSEIATWRNVETRHLPYEELPQHLGPTWVWMVAWKPWVVLETLRDYHRVLWIDANA